MVNFRQEILNITKEYFDNNVNGDSIKDYLNGKYCLDNIEYKNGSDGLIYTYIINDECVYVYEKNNMDASGSKYLKFKDGRGIGCTLGIRNYGMGHEIVTIRFLKYHEKQLNNTIMYILDNRIDCLFEMYQLKKDVLLYKDSFSDITVSKKEDLFEFLKHPLFDELLYLHTKYVFGC